MSLIGRGLLTLVLGGGAAALGLTLAERLDETAASLPRGAPVPPPAVLAEDESEIAEFEPPPRNGLAQIATRPPFSKSRKPYEPPPAAPPPPPTPLTVLVLMGVTNLGGERAALLRPADGGAALWIREQEAIAGWTVVEIGEAWVRLEENGREATLELLR